MRLLIAEDELDLAEALTVFFEKNHFTVDAVHNGFDAYEYAAADADQRELLALIAGNRGTIPVSDTAPAHAPEPPDMPEVQTPPRHRTGRGYAPCRSQRGRPRTPRRPFHGGDALSKRNQTGPAVCRAGFLRPSQREPTK